MGYFAGAFFSETLQMTTQLGVILPQDAPEYKEKKKKPKTLILLHGLGDNYQAWITRTSVLRYAEQYGVAVLMPEVCRSWYADMRYGRNYFTYITKELPEYASAVFHISVKPEDCMIAGLSMGGYGALKCGLTYPEKYMGIGAFSAAWEIEDHVLQQNIGNSFDKTEIEKDSFSIFGAERKIPETCDIRALLEKADRSQSRPFIYLVCGKEDFLYNSNVKLKQMFEKSKQNCKYSEMTGEHEWKVWDKAIQYFLAYIIDGKIPKECIDE